MDREVLTLLAEHDAGLTTCDDPRTVVWVHHLVANLEHARAPLPDEHRHPVRSRDSSPPQGSEAQIAVREGVLLQPPQGLADLARPAAIEPVDVLELASAGARSSDSSAPKRATRAVADVVADARQLRERAEAARRHRRVDRRVASPWPRISARLAELEHPLVRAARRAAPRRRSAFDRRGADRVVADERQAVARHLADQLGELHLEQPARRCRARRAPARSPGRRGRRARAAAAPRARRRASRRPGTRARSAAVRPGRGAGGRSRASRRPGSSSRARRRPPRAGSAARRRRATRCRAAARSRSRAPQVWRATRSAVRCRVPVSADAIVGSGISWTFAWTMRLARRVEDDRAVHLRELVQVLRRERQVDLHAAREHELQLARVAEHDQCAEMAA